MTPTHTASLFDLVAEDPAAPGPAPPTRPEPGRAVAEAARSLVPVLEAGRRLAAPVVTAALHDAWHRLDPAGRSWNSKLCYDAAEAATAVPAALGPAMREQADTPAAFLAMIERIAALEPTHSHRSEHQVAFDQFSTPAAARLRRLPRGGRPPRRHRAGALRRHGRARGAARPPSSTTARACTSTNSRRCATACSPPSTPTRP